MAVSTPVETATQRYAEAYESFAQGQARCLVLGDEVTAGDFAALADRVRRAIVAEWDDPDPVLVEPPCICIECQRFRSAGNHEAVD